MMWPFASSQRQRGLVPEGSQDGPEPLMPAPVIEHEESSLAGETFKVTGQPNQRLGMHPILRGPILGVATFICGFSIGAAHGGPVASYRYRAENAHRLPTTQTGWFLYQKSKNYHTLLGSMKEGTKYGGILLVWSTLFMLAEEGIDHARARLFAPAGEDCATGQRDAANTVLAAMGVAGFYSWKNGLDQFAAARTARLALRVSLPFGLIQDVAASLRGNEPAYIRWIMAHTFWPEKEIKI